MMCFCSLVKHLYYQVHSVALDINQGFTPIYIYMALIFLAF